MAGQFEDAGEEFPLILQLSATEGAASIPLFGFSATTLAFFQKKPGTVHARWAISTE